MSHQPPASRRHDDFYCDQIALGRDVSEYKPEIRLRREAALHAAQMRMEVGTLRALRGRYDGGFEDGDAHFTSRRPRLWRLRRAWMRLRGCLRRCSVVNWVRR